MKLPFTTPQKKIAITGLSHSGKTIFILSLLQHLKYFNNDEFNLGQDIFLNQFEQIYLSKSESQSFKEFPFGRFITSMVPEKGGLPTLPKKTEGYYRFKLSIACSGKTILDFLDFPGERLVDVEIYKQSDFATWSKKIISTLESNHSTSNLVSDYERNINSLEDNAHDILKAYKFMMGEIAGSYSQLVTPSSFILDWDDDSTFDPEKVPADERTCGLQSMEFCPLTPEIIKQRPELVKIFSKHYKEYRKKKVKPLFEYLDKCDQVLFLIDIPTILASGPPRYNGTVSILESWASILKPSKWWSPFSHLKQVAFVATKKDMIDLGPDTNKGFQPVNPNNDRLQKLLQDLMGRMKSIKPLLTYGAFSVSAWKSTRYKGEKSLECVPLKIKGQKNTDQLTIKVPDLPEKWPTDSDDWNYKFPKIWLKPLSRNDQLPEQMNMEEVFKFIMGNRLIKTKKK